MRDFARYVILSPVMPASAMARPIPSHQSGNPFCDPGTFDASDMARSDAKPLPSKSLAQDKRDPAS